MLPAAERAPQGGTAPSWRLRWPTVGCGAGRRRSFRGEALSPLAGSRARHAEPLRRGDAGAGVGSLCGPGARRVGKSLKFVPTCRHGALRQLASGDGGGGTGLLPDEAARLPYRRFQ